jgi:hypothetical protein
VIDIPALRGALSVDQDWVIVEPGGTPLDWTVPPNAGPATLLVSRVTDAVMRIEPDGLFGGSVDRERLWAVDAFLLNRVVLDELRCGPVDPQELLDAVRETGIAWQVVLMPSGS